MIGLRGCYCSLLSSMAWYGQTATHRVHPVHSVSLITTLFSSVSRPGQPNSLMHAMQFVHFSVTLHAVIFKPFRRFSDMVSRVQGERKMITDGPSVFNASFTMFVASLTLNGVITLTYLTPQPLAISSIDIFSVCVFMPVLPVPG